MYISMYVMPKASMILKNQGDRNPRLVNHMMLAAAKEMTKLFAVNSKSAIGFWFPLSSRVHVTMAIANACNSCPPKSQALVAMFSHMVKSKNANAIIRFSQCFSGIASQTLMLISSDINESSLLYVSCCLHCGHFHYLLEFEGGILACV